MTASAADDERPAPTPASTGAAPPSRTGATPPARTGATPRDAEEALREAQSLNSLILESSHDCTVVLDLDGLTEYVSPGGIASMEISDVQRILGLSWLRVWQGADHEAACAAVAQARAGGIGRFRGQCPTHEGRPKWWDVVISPLPGPDGRPQRLVSIGRDVTEQMLAEISLRDADARLRKLNADLERQVVERALHRGRTWSISPDMLGVLNADGYFENSNPAWQTVLGWSEAEVASTVFFDFLHPDDLEKTHAAFKDAKQDIPVFRFENRYRTRAGDYRWLSWTAVPEAGKVYCSARDVTVEKAQADELAARTVEHDRIWRNSRDLVLIVGADGIFRAVSPAWTAVLGHDTSEVVGRSFLEFVWPDDAELTQGGLEAATTRHDLTDFENRYRHKDGTPRWISWRTTLEGDFIYAYGRHITEEKAAAAELALAQEALRQSQKLEAVGQLTGGVAHDFNNLLTIIRTSIDLLRRPNLAEARRQKFMDAISDTVTRAAKLTGQLLAFARRQALQPEVFDVGGNVAAIGDMVGTLTGSRIHVDARPPAEPCFVNADPSQFDTAVVNMAVNARDAMAGEGRLTIAVRAVSCVPQVRHHPPVTGEFVAISLVDTGVGIAPALMDRIFEPFYTTKQVGQGTGLGLSQVFGFVKQSGGEVLVESEVGRGTTFTLYLPRVDAPAAATSGPVDEPQPLVDGRGACILVVEDNPQVGAVAELTLRELGFGTVFAANADEALAALAEDPSRFHAVLSDVVMPGMNGIDLGHEIRRRHGDLPVVLTSGYSHVLAQSGSHGFDLLHKPYSVDQLSRVLRNAAAARLRGG